VAELLVYLGELVFDPPAVGLELRSPTLKLVDPCEAVIAASKQVRDGGAQLVDSLLVLRKSDVLLPSLQELDFLLMVFVERPAATALFAVEQVVDELRLDLGWELTPLPGCVDGSGSRLQRHLSESEVAVAGHSFRQFGRSLFQLSAIVVEFFPVSL